MKIGFMMGPTLTGKQNGIVSQALTWREEMIKQGHSVYLLTPWETVDWASFDVIHSFGISAHLDILKKIKEKGAKSIAISPIFDSERPAWVMKLLSYTNFPYINCKTVWSAFRDSLACADMIFVRSEYEKIRLEKIFNLDLSKTYKIPLSPRFLPDEAIISSKREKFCLHVSILSSPNKNVITLIEAAKKYGFDLRLAGHINSVSFEKYINQQVELNPNISYLGVLNDEHLRECFNTAKVFALPSILEGVGLVALEAASLGCDIVITNRGGPKEYYGQSAKVINPLDVDEVGESVMHFLNGNTYQPELSRKISDENRLSTLIEQMISIYST